MRSIKGLFSKQEEDEQGIISEVENGCVSLSWSTRLKGFACCFGLGVLLSFLGNLFLWIPHTGLKLFALFYTLGNLFSLTSSFFLMGPVQQCKRMFAETRIIAAVLVILFMVLTIVSAVVWGKPVLCLLFSVFQFIALTWYSISYIPFARDAVKRCCTSIC
uniref:Vesicle transport protein n=1 Tax=Schistocephalus solidus TaxID=70667 RepID=A0A0X3PMI2_SCHSO